nr:MAG TPA: hypothetical protein [Caudoviricetes sp.]
MERLRPSTPGIGIHDCCEILRANQIQKTERILAKEIQAGMYSWAVPSVGTKRISPTISRAGFIAWIKDFYMLKEVRIP